MNKVYLLVSGEYSDYGIESVFSTEERAKEAMEAYRLGNHSDYRIEEWDLDPVDGTQHLSKLRAGYRLYMAAMDFDGNNSYCHEANFLHGTRTCTYVRGDLKAMLSVMCWAKSREHATKITNERRTKLKALNMLTVPLPEHLTIDSEVNYLTVEE